MKNIISIALLALVFTACGADETKTSTTPLAPAAEVTWIPVPMSEAEHAKNLEGTHTEINPQDGSYRETKSNGLVLTYASDGQLLRVDQPSL